MKRFGVIALLFCWGLAQGGPFDIENFRDRYNRCDYLVVTPQIYAEQAERLVEHRNSFQNDDVHDARLAKTENLISEFSASDTTAPHEALWRAFQYAYNNWYEPLRYIVLIGSDSIHWDSTGAILTSYGLMPSFHNGYYVYSAHRDTFVQYSDDYYLTVDRTDPLPALRPDYKLRISIGRIPCETSEQLGNYIDKVIHYDYSLETDLRGNRALLLADDAMQGRATDPLRFAHFTSAETVARETVLEQFQLTKLYLSMYEVNENYRHEEARQVFLNEINRGQKWVLFFGHGCPAYVSDEVTVHANDVDHFAQDSEPFFFYSFSCRNGAYHIPYNESMAKHFLFKAGGGALAFVASTALEYSTPSLYFARQLFGVLDTVQNVSIGRMMLLAKRNTHNMGVQYYHLLGDPALRAGGRRVSPALTFNGTDLSIQVDEISFNGTYYVTVSSIDTLKLFEDTSRTYIDGNILYTEGKVAGSGVGFDLSAFSEQHVKVNVYVTDGNSEGRADTSLIIKNSSAALPRIASVPGSVQINNRGGQLRVYYTAPQQGESICVVLFDLRGRKVFENTITTPSFFLDLKKQGIGPGNYLLRVKEGKRTVAQKGVMLVH